MLPPEAVKIIETLLIDERQAIESVPRRASQMLTNSLPAACQRGMFAHGQCKFAALSTAHAVSMLGATRDGT